MNDIADESLKRIKEIMGKVCSGADAYHVLEVLRDLVAQAKAESCPGKPENESQGGRSDVPPPTITARGPLLVWLRCKYHDEAVIGDFIGGDGVRFTLEKYPTCYRRGPWKLMIEVAEGPGHEKWGCFDFQDQPVRFFHQESAARSEAEIMAKVLQVDRWTKS